MISSYVALLERKYRGRLDGDADAYIHFAVDGARRMRQLITDLLSYARVGRAVATLRPTSLERVFDEAVQNLHVAIAERRAIVTRGDLPIVMGDAVQLVQLLQNLLANAVKFNSSDPPRAAVTAEAVGSEWRICVADNGIGIESDHRERVFRIFQRLHPRGEYPGTGVGLAICRRIVERHGGRIWVESIPGEGTRLMWTLPTPQEA